MSAKHVPKKSSRKLSPEDRERIAAAALAHPEFGARRLAGVLAAEGLNATESALVSALREQGLNTSELRFKLLEERHLKDGLALSDSQQQALHDFNPCLRERLLECRQPGLLLIQDAVGLGKIKNIDRAFLHAAIDPCCCLAFAALAGSRAPAAAVAVLNDQALVFYRREGIALQRVIAGNGLVSIAGADPEYLKYLQSHGISLTMPPAGDQPKNGFIERFERLVRKDFLTLSLRSQDFQGFGGIQSAFNDWLEQYNNETSLPGYPNMGRTPLEAFRVVAAPEAAQPQSADKPALEPEPDPVSPPASVAAAQPPPPTRPPKHHEEETGRAIWGFRAVNAALCCLVIYFGWLVASKFLDYRQPVESFNPEALAQPAPSSEDAQDRPPSIDEYHVVWGRNLFGVSAPSQAAAKREKFDVDKIAAAGRDVGLKLIGTAVANDPQLNYAVIDVTATREQGIFREKDRVGKAVIKAILRNNVIIETEDGQRRKLTIDEDMTKEQRTGRTGIGYIAESTAASINPDNVERDINTFQVPRNEVPSSPSDIKRVIEELSLTPQINEGNMGGFSIGRLRAKNILSRIGLRTADTIKGVGDDEFDSPEDIELFFQRLAKGGNFTVLIERRGQVQKLNVLVQ